MPTLSLSVTVTVIWPRSRGHVCRSSDPDVGTPLGRITTDLTVCEDILVFSQAFGSYPMVVADLWSYF